MAGSLGRFKAARGKVGEERQGGERVVLGGGGEENPHREVSWMSIHDGPSGRFL